MQRVDEFDTPPVVGRWYLVPCIHLTRSKAWGSGTGWWPTIGPIHEDKELIGFKPRHVHLDPRFLTPTQLARHLKGRSPRSPTVDSVLAAPICFDHPEKGVLFPEAKAVYRRRRCFYVMPNWRALVARNQELIGRLLRRCKPPAKGIHV